MKAVCVMRGIARAESVDYYREGLQHMRYGRLQQAILSLQSAAFFTRDDANAVVALAECYVCLCDLHSAVLYYRRALWILQQRNEAQRAAHGSSGCSNSSRVSQAPLPPSSSLPVPPAGAAQVRAVPAGGGGGVTTGRVTERLIGVLDALGLVLFQMSDFVQALRCAEEALELRAGAPDPVVELHRCVYLIALRREEEAEYKLEAYVPRFATHEIHGAALLIQLYCNRQAFRPARLLLQKHVSILHEHSLTIARHIFHDKYHRYRTKALARQDLNTISRCIEVFPNDVELLFTRAQLLIAAGKHKRSVKDLFRCIRETNGSHKQAVETMTSVLFTIGSTLDGELGIEEAVTYYSESLKWRADNTLVLLARGDCYVKLEDYESALQDYRRILRINPDDHVANNRIAFLHDLWGRKMCQLGRIRDAETEFTNAIKTSDSEPLFYFHRALCRFELDEPRYALRDVLSCHQLHPTDPELCAFIERFLGTRDAPTTTAQDKERWREKYLWQDSQGRPHLVLEHLPQSALAAQKRAAALYGQPSARLQKLCRERDASPPDAAIASGRTTSVSRTRQGEAGARRSATLCDTSIAGAGTSTPTLPSLVQGKRSCIFDRAQGGAATARQPQTSR